MFRKSLAALSALALVAVPAGAAEITLDQVKAAAEKLRTLAETELKETGIPGIAIAVVFKDEVILAQGFGVREVGKPEPVDADTVFQLASVSKPLGSTVVAALVGDGVVSWDSRISEFDPDFEMSEPWVTREITIRDLYCHRSGLPEHTGDLLEDIGYPRAEILRRLRFQKPDSSFRSGYAYTNFGMTEAAIAAAKAAGKEWEDLSAEKLYKPLGMTSTSSRYADFEKRRNRALGHRRRDGKWVRGEQRQPDAQTPAGGVSSSVNDLAKWMRLQLGNGKFEGKRIVDADALEETHHPHILTGFSPLDGLPGFYGLGWNVSYDTEGRLRLSHSGAFALGAATYVGLVPSEQLGVVVLANAAPIGVPEGLGNTFLEDALYGEPRPDWLAIFKKVFAQMDQAERDELTDYSKPPASPAPAAPNADYLGTYTSDYFGDITISEKDGTLYVALGPEKRTYPMRHWDRDLFTYEPTGENAVGTSGIAFTMNPENKAFHVIVENLNVHGEGIFQRKADAEPAPDEVPEN